MKNQSNNQHGMFVSIGNQNAIAQRNKANKTKVITALFFANGKNYSRQGWLAIQTLYEQLVKETGKRIEGVKKFGCMQYDFED